MSRSIYDTIDIFRNDHLPDIRVQLVDEDSGEPIDLSSPLTTLTGKFRKRRTSDVIYTVTLSKPNGGKDGIVLWRWPTDGIGNLEAGRYEAEISISFNGKIQTVKDKLVFRLREVF